MTQPLDRAGHLREDITLLFLQGELPADAARRVEKHLCLCTACREKVAVLRSMDQALAPLNRQALPDASAARARLAASLIPIEPRHGFGWMAALARPTIFFRIAAVAALCVVAATYRQATRPLQELMATYEETGPKPDHTLTPGSANALSVAQVCERSDDDLDPKVPLETQQAVFHAYRLDARRAKAYQVDYLINPQLGGDSTLQNLWPEPYHATVWNATAKDALETRLHGMVCNGQIDLQSAQQELATDWIAAYKKYFHATRPVKTVAILGKPKELRARP
ncbi:MAG: anti-sigma factor family protein [Janthinobacterium lividum]